MEERVTNIEIKSDLAIQMRLTLSEFFAVFTHQRWQMPAKWALRRCIKSRVKPLATFRFALLSPALELQIAVIQPLLILFFPIAIAFRSPSLPAYPPRWMVTPLVFLVP